MCKSCTVVVLMNLYIYVYRLFLFFFFCLLYCTRWNFPKLSIFLIKIKQKWGERKFSKAQGKQTFSSASCPVARKIRRQVTSARSKIKCIKAQGKELAFFLLPVLYTIVAWNFPKIPRKLKRKTKNKEILKAHANIGVEKIQGKNAFAMHVYSRFFFFCSSVAARPVSSTMNETFQIFWESRKNLRETGRILPKKFKSERKRRGRANTKNPLLSRCDWLPQEETHTTCNTQKSGTCYPSVTVPPGSTPWRNTSDPYSTSAFPQALIATAHEKKKKRRIFREKSRQKNHAPKKKVWLPCATSVRLRTYEYSKVLFTTTAYAHFLPGFLKQKVAVRESESWRGKKKPEKGGNGERREK